MFRVNSVGFSNFWYRTYNQNLTGSRDKKIRRPHRTPWALSEIHYPHGIHSKHVPTRIRIDSKTEPSFFQEEIRLHSQSKLNLCHIIWPICFRWAIKWTWYLQATDFQYPHFFSFVFNVFDNNGDGFIEFDEFLQVRTLNWLSMTSNLACFRFFGSRVRSEGQFRDQLFP